VVVLVRGDTTVVCGVLPPDGGCDLSVVDGLARLQLAARRLGGSIMLRGVGAELAELLDLAGLADILPAVLDDGGEIGRKAEGGKQLGVEEGVQPGDPVPRDLEHLE
jgi:hypothetical protein